MTQSQLMTLINELRLVELELLDISMGLTIKDPDTALKVSNANGRLLEVTGVLTKHLDEQEIES